MRGDGYGVRIRKTKSNSVPAASRATRRMLPRAPRYAPVPPVMAIAEGPSSKKGPSTVMEPPSRKLIHRHSQLTPTSIRTHSPCIRPHHVLVPGVEQIVVEREQITGRIAVRGEIDDGVGGRMLDHGQTGHVRTRDRHGHERDDQHERARRPDPEREPKLSSHPRTPFSMDGASWTDVSRVANRAFGPQAMWTFDRAAWPFDRWASSPRWLTVPGCKHPASKRSGRALPGSSAEHVNTRSSSMETATIGRASTPSAGVPGSRRTPPSWARRGFDPPLSHPLRHAGGLWEHEQCAPRSHNPPVV